MNVEIIKLNLINIKHAIASAEKKYSRTSNTTTLVAISKTQNIDTIKKAYNLEQLHFGESYIQEAIPKIQALTDTNIIWHYVGRIQSKKIKLIAPNFSWVETVTNLEIAESLNKHRPTDLPPLNICIQVNISNESTKAGILIDEILPLAQKIVQLPKIKLRGLMTIPAYNNDFTQQLNTFKKLADEFQKLKSHDFAIDTLSMGMTNDFEAAIAAGATEIRIGTGVFGDREY